MFAKRTDLKLPLRNCLDGIHATCNDELQGMQKKNQIISYNDIINVLSHQWDLTFSDSFYGLLLGQLSEDEKRVLEEARKQIQADLLNYLPIISSTITPDVRINNWVTKEIIDKRYYWPLCKKWMSEEYSPAIAQNIDLESEEVLKSLHNPIDQEKWSTRGLVMGQIQRGKTANYCGVICKAADAGYKLIIVLSGIHNDLRKQTQKRLDETFVGRYTDIIEGLEKHGACGVGIYPTYKADRAPNVATTRIADFKGTSISFEDKPWLFVIKKNSSVFKKLVKWIKQNIAHRDRLPLLLIDDEADLASINTKDKEELATVTNRFIRQILSLFPRSSFVGYTATPFANILIDSNASNDDIGLDLFPKDFIVRLASPRNYFGPKDFFGDNFESGLELYDCFPQEEAFSWFRDLEKNYGNKELPKTPSRAILQFILSSSLKLWRHMKRKGIPSVDNPLHNSMLIHVSHKIAIQKAIGRQVQTKLREICQDLRGIDLRASECSYLKELRNLFDLQKNEITPEIKRRRSDEDISDPINDWAMPNKFEELDSCLQQVIGDIQIELVNGEAKRNVIYQAENSAYFEEKRTSTNIYIGGNKLSRGLTLNGLTVSVFLRSSSMYDTLMQMGRWFGYRDGYIDLCRLITTPDIIDKFRQISEAIDDFNVQIDEMNSHNRSPENFRLKILSHPGLMVTARNKMRNSAEFEVGFNGQTSWKMCFDLNNDLIHKNFGLAINLINRLNKWGRMVYRSDSTTNELNNPDPSGNIKHPMGRLWKDVPSEVISDFLQDYSPLAKEDLEIINLQKYLREMEKEGKLTKWVVWVPGEPVSTPTGIEKYLGSLPVDRTRSENGCSDGSYSETQVSLSILKSGGSELFGLPKDVYETAKEEAKNKKLVFRTVRQVAGRKEFGISNQGFFQLIPFTSKRLKNHEALRSSEGSCPIVSYYMWLPDMENASKYTKAVFNTTVSEEDDDLMEDEE